VTENHYLSLASLPGVRRLGVPPRPPLTEMKDLRATVTDAIQSTTFRLYSSAAAPVTGAEAPRHPLPRCQGPRHKVQARHARYSEILRNPW